MRCEQAAVDRGICALLLGVLLGTAAPPSKAADDRSATATLESVRPALHRQADVLLNMVRLQVADCTAGPPGIAVLDRVDPAAGNAPTDADLPTLRWNDQLAEAAARHAGAMARTRVFAHVGTDGTTVRERVDAAGYRWQAVAETLAAGQTELPEALADWLASASHCAALTDRRFTEFGLARTVAEHPHDAYGTYWALVLGRPR